MKQGSIESGELLPVLQRATHEELKAIAEAINKSFDVFITWDSRYYRHSDDLTQIPEVIAEYLCRSGGHSLVNLWRGGGPDYAECVRDVCEMLKVRPLPDDMPVIDMEIALLRDLLNKARVSLPAAEQEMLRQKMEEVAGGRTGWEEMLKGGAQFTTIATSAFAFLGQQAVRKGVLVIGQQFAGRLSLSVLGPMGIVLGVIWTANSIADPSYHGLVPAIMQVALLRQRMLNGLSL